MNHWGRACRDQKPCSPRRWACPGLGLLGLSNGTAESVNAKVQAAIARGRGFRMHSHLMTVIYLTCGKLTHLPVPSYTRPISAA